MNQVTNLIQWKNHTDEQKADFDFENYMYTVQTPTNTTFSVVTHKERPTSITDFASVYRLVIEDDKWYTCVSEDAVETIKGSEVYRRIIENDKWYTCVSEDAVETIKVSEFANPDKAICLRPARNDEIPVAKEKTLEQKIQEKWPDKEVVMITHRNGNLRIVKKIGSFEYDRPHIFAQSMKGFYKYVYNEEKDLVHVYDYPTKPWKGKTLQPVAVLFEE